MSGAEAYAAVGVDVEAGDRAVALMKTAVARTHTANPLGRPLDGLGGFAGLFDASVLAGMRHPVLATSTDGVGTKVALAQQLDLHTTIGQDLVGMVVDDIVVTGARPLFMTDYIACGRVVPERIAAIVSGIAAACEAVQVALIGGETAEHPGLLDPDEYDVAGAATGVVERDAILGPDRVRPGDVLVAMASSGLHSNGYSLVRHLIASGPSLETEVAEFGRTLGEELLEPTRLYTVPVLQMAQLPGVHAFTHITGGGLAANLARVLPPALTVSVDRGAWAVPPVFRYLAAQGNLTPTDVEDTWNLGVGMVAVVAPEAVDATISISERHQIPAWALGEIGTQGPTSGARVVSGAKGVDGGAVHLVGSYR